jgi:hypothetical protein
MPKILLLVLMGLGGYYLFQKRFRVVNFLVRNTITRRLFVTAMMNIPGIKSRMLNFVFPKEPSPTS